MWAVLTFISGAVCWNFRKEIYEFGKQLYNDIEKTMEDKVKEKDKT